MNIKSYKEFMSESVTDIIRSKKEKSKKEEKKFQKYKPGDIIEANFMYTNEQVDVKIMIKPYWNDDENWIQTIVKYEKDTWLCYWSINKKTWVLKEKV